MDSKLMTAVENRFRYTLLNTVHNAIKFNFPKIEDLEVSLSDDEAMISVKFTGGATEEAVRNFLNQFRKQAE